MATTASRHTAPYTTEYVNDANKVEYQTADAEHGTWARVTVNGVIVAGPERNTSEMLRAYQREIRKAQRTNR